MHILHCTYTCNKPKAKLWTFSTFGGFRCDAFCTTTTTMMMFVACFWVLNFGTQSINKLLCSFRGICLSLTPPPLTHHLLYPSYVCTVYFSLSHLSSLFLYVFAHSTIVHWLVIVCHFSDCQRFIAAIVVIIFHPKQNTNIFPTEMFPTRSKFCSYSSWVGNHFSYPAYLYHTKYMIFSMSSVWLFDVFQQQQQQNKTKNSWENK